jgi:hypothetical protein
MVLWIEPRALRMLMRCHASELLTALPIFSFGCFTIGFGSKGYLYVLNKNPLLGMLSANIFSSISHHSHHRVFFS